MKEISDIIFDLGNVLVPFDWNIALERLTYRLPERFLEMVRRDPQGFKHIFLKGSENLETGRLSFESFWERMCGELGTRLSLEEFRFMWCDIFEADESMIELGWSLAAKYRVWLASNTCSEHYEWIIHRFPRIKFFRKAALSYELGVMKPSLRYYARALQLFNISPYSSLFIDDVQENVEGARAMGMQGVVFIGYKQLTAQLTKYGIAKCA